jgi:hypothetical protein
MIGKKIICSLVALTIFLPAVSMADTPEQRDIPKPAVVHPNFQNTAHPMMSGAHRRIHRMRRRIHHLQSEIASIKKKHHHHHHHHRHHHHKSTTKPA